MQVDQDQVQVRMELRRRTTTNGSTKAATAQGPAELPVAPLEDQPARLHLRRHQVHPPATAAWRHLDGSSWTMAPTSGSMTPGQLLEPDQLIPGRQGRTKPDQDRGARVRVPVRTAAGCCSLMAPTRGAKRPTPHTHLDLDLEERAKLAKR